MTENEQIEEIATLITEGARQSIEDAEAIYRAGYRKQLEVRWIACGMFGDIFKCSNCNENYTVYEACKYNFCPTCGGRVTNKC